MANVTIYDVYDALGLTAENGTQTLINSIRNSTELGGMSELFDGSVEGLQNFGVAVNRTNRTRNIFINELVDRIGVVVIERTALKNPFSRFKKGKMSTGRVVEEVFADLIKANAFNPEDASQTLFKRNPPNVRVLFHDNWRKEIYTNTIEKDTIVQAFTSLDKFNEFIVSIYDSMYNSNEVDEFIWAMGLIQSYVANGYAHYVETPAVTSEATAKQFVKKARATSTKLTLSQGSRLYNASGVHTRTPKERLWLLIDAELDATLDVEVLARAFNMSRTDVENKKIVIENFQLNGLQAVLFDENILQIRDKVFEMNAVENPKGLYFNTFLHAHQLYSMGKYQNLVAFMSADIPPITRLIMTPVSSYITIGQKKVLDVVTEFSDSAIDDFTPTVTITDESGNVVTGAKANFVLGKGNQHKVEVTVTNTQLVDQNLTVNLILTQTEVPEGKEAFTRNVSTLIVPLQATEG